jgi:hypothetical protein
MSIGGLRPQSRMRRGAPCAGLRASRHRPGYVHGLPTSTVARLAFTPSPASGPGPARSGCPASRTPRPQGPSPRGGTTRGRSSRRPYELPYEPSRLYTGPATPDSGHSPSEPRLESPTDASRCRAGPGTTATCLVSMCFSPRRGHTAAIGASVCQTAARSCGDLERSNSSPLRESRWARNRSANHASHRYAPEFPAWPPHLCHTACVCCD